MNPLGFFYCPQTVYILRTQGQGVDATKVLLITSLRYLPHFRVYKSWPPTGSIGVCVCLDTCVRVGVCCTSVWVGEARIDKRSLTCNEQQCEVIELIHNAE